MSAALQSHWNDVYGEKRDAQTSWYRPHIDESLRLIDALNLPSDAAVLDVGGGRSALVDDLLARGFENISVLDISSVALDETRARLGAKASAVHWIVGDVTEIDVAPGRYGLWHDRAVFHFMIEPDARTPYVAVAARAVRPGGYAVIGTFAEDGPPRCSGLPVARYGAEALAEIFAPAFEKVSDCRDIHRTPSGCEQAFTYVVLRRRHDATV